MNGSKRASPRAIMEPMRNEDENEAMISEIDS